MIDEHARKLDNTRFVWFEKKFDWSKNDEFIMSFAAECFAQFLVSINIHEGVKNFPCLKFTYRFWATLAGVPARTKQATAWPPPNQVRTG